MERKEFTRGLPQKIEIEFIEGGKDIIVTADGTQFPFPISEFSITYTPEEGAIYNIAAGNSNRTASGLSFMKDAENLSILTTNEVLSPSNSGIIPMDDDEDDYLDLVGDVQTMLNKFNPNRESKIVRTKDAVRGYKERGICSPQSDILVYRDEHKKDDLTKLLKSLAEEEKELLDDYTNSIDKDTKFYVLAEPSLSLDGLNKAFLKERFMVYEK